MLVHVRIPRYPECWESCGACGQGEVIVDDILVLPGDVVQRGDVLLVLETGKVALDIPAPVGGKISAVLVAAGEAVSEGDRIVSIDTF